MSDVHHIYLVPGFFGFANLGRFRYFLHVHNFLLARGQALGADVRVHVVRTRPTSGIPTRAARIVETMATTLRGRRGVAHLVGHSTGGLDARLLAAPGITLPTELDIDRYAERVRSVITVATPHDGSPLASLLATMRGQQLLAVLSVGTAYALRFGHVPVSALAQMAALVARPATWPLRSTLFDEIARRLLADFSIGRRRAVQKLLREVATDQSLLVQLMPEAIEVFNATVTDRPGVRYGSIVTRGARPGVRSTLDAGLDPAAQAMHGLYSALHRLAGSRRRLAARRLAARQSKALRHAYGQVPGPTANDGIVPTRSQVWGEIVAAVDADHLDVIGHFNEPSRRPPHYDWLTTGSGFDRAQFERVWSGVLRFLLDQGSR